MSVSIGSGNIAKIRLAEQGSDPSTPASGFGYVYEKSDGGLYFINDADVVVGPLAKSPTLVSGTATYLAGVQTISLEDGLTVGVTGTVAFIKSSVGALTSWTPTVTQSGTITHTVSYAKYQQVGNVVHVWASLAITGVGVAGNDVRIGNLPFPEAGGGCVGVGYILDNGTGYYVGTARRILNTTSIAFNAHLETDEIGTDPSFALASGDSISFQITYVVV